MTTKIHQVVDGNGLPLAIVVTGGQRNDGAMLEAVLNDIRVPRPGGGRPRTTPDAVLADKAYGSRINRQMLRSRGIRCVIPEKSDQTAARKRKGQNGGRPSKFDEDAYKDRNVVERSFALIKQWRGIATRYDKLAITYRAAAVLHAALTWATLLGEVA
ncbi:Mobile element protein [Microbacterium esteraromaticum]|uniref:Mobile element protein n=1 Tax=Microbacterium esteraromaticum TaxID=57043 RepID=A0A1R4JSL2_9MICO|nr:Mobile element protein [Microbacterium esteraromaticum]